jgi:hypothetical protein
VVQVNKTQQPSQASRVQIPKRQGSILARAVPVEQIDTDFIKFVLYGQNRVGKTTLACQFPKPLLLVSFEPSQSGGATSVKKVQGVTYIRITTTEDALRLADELKSDTTFKSHVLDTATSYQDIILQEILKLPAVPEQLNWGMVSRDQYRERSEKTKEALRPFLNLKAHTVICAKERDHNPPDKEKPKILRGFQAESFFASDLGGATVGWLHDACDYIGRLYIDKEVAVRTTKNRVTGADEQEEYETGRTVRRLRTMYHPNFAAGFRSCDPESVPEFIDNPTFDRIYQVIQGKKLR